MKLKLKPEIWIDGENRILYGILHLPPTGEEFMFCPFDQEWSSLECLIRMDSEYRVDLRELLQKLAAFTESNYLRNYIY